MSWSPELPIGEFRPWPDTVHVVRGRTGETLRYVPEQAVAATLGRSAWDDGYLGELSRMRLEVELLRSENDKLRELVRDMWNTARLCDANAHIEGMRLTEQAREEYMSRMEELGVEV